MQQHGCEQCGCPEVLREWADAFGVRLCGGCRRHEQLISKVGGGAALSGLVATRSPPWHTHGRVQQSSSKALRPTGTHAAELLRCRCCCCTAWQTNAKSRYVLTDADLAKAKLGHLAKTNPQHKEWTPMRMYLLRQASQRESPRC